MRTSPSISLFNSLRTRDSSLFIAICYCGLILCIALVPLASYGFEGDMEKDLQRSLFKSRDIVATIQNKLQSGASINSEITQIKTAAENIRITHLLLEERFKIREEKIKTLGSKAVERHQVMAEGYHKALTEYLSLIDGLSSDGVIPQSEIRNLQTLLEKLLPKKHRPILGTLPYIHLNYPAQEPNSAPPIVPAYKGGNKIVGADDTKGTPEAPISQEIADLAQSLNWNPVSIYEYVKNNVETEWYFGCMKGAEDTLHQKSGNDCDQATLLTALLRASGFPTRYVRGVIEFFPDMEQVKNLTGIDDPNNIAEFFQKAGIPYTPVIQGGKITNFQIEHVWVESQIPYSNYRGAIIDDMGKTWLGLDTSIKVKGYTYNNAPDILSTMSLSTVRDDYFSLTTSISGTTQPVPVPTPLEYIQSYVNTQLASSESYSNYLRNKTLMPEVLNILPASVQFTLIKATNEYARIPDELIHQVKFTATDPNQSQLFTITLPSYKLSNQQIAISYEPETVQDQEIIDSYGGLDNTPAYLVHLRPVLKVNDERIVVAQGGVPMGGQFNLAIDLISPNGTQSITNSQIVGNLSVIGISAQKAVIQPQSDPSQQKDAARLLYEEAMNYNDRWNKAEDELASLLHLGISRPLPSVVTLGGVIDVTYLLDTPHGFTWTGVFIDAGLKRIETVTGTQDMDDRVQTFMKLSSLQGSILENRIFEDDFQVQSVSTAKLMTVANGSQIPIITIDTTNVASVLPTLPFDQNIKDDITNAVNQKLTIRIPQSEITYQDWTGIGYIKENSITGESGWMLSGMIAGGMTAWDVSRWNDIIAGTLSSPYSEPPNYDPTSAQYISKILDTDMQDGTVGAKLSQPLQVRVLDAKKKPVKNVRVTFIIKTGGGTFGSDFNNIITTITMTTNTQGIASANPTLGRFTKDNPTFVWEEGYTYSQQAGENIIDAALPSGVNLTMPFTVLGIPKDPHHLSALYGNNTWGVPLSFVGFVSASLQDIYNNPISNATVTFSVADPVQNPDHQCEWTTIDTVHKTYLTEIDLACLTNSPSWGTCGDTHKQTLAVKTAATDASAEVILGGMDNAIYTITAIASSLSTSFHLYTYELYSYAANPCSGTNDPYRQLMTSYVYTADMYGNNINAGKTGTTVPVKASMHYFLEKWAMKEVPCGSDPCSKVAGIRSYETTTDFTNPSMTFGETAGTPQGPGIYTANYRLQAGKNEIPVKGTATITVKNTHMNCPDVCTTVNEPLTQSDTSILTVYGVMVQTQPIPILLIDQNGYLSSSQTITYTIEPLSSDYSAMTAYVMIYKDGEIVAQIPTEKKGTGTAILSRGFQFDVNSKYEAEVILNYGTGVEVRSEKLPLKVIMFKIVKPSVNEQVLIQNDTYGNPKMKPLTAQVELKGSSIAPDMINSQNICWKFKVEYLVNTVKAPQRARKGLDPSGAGNGNDGFLIPPYPMPPAPGQLDCINYTGSTFVIDDSGANGTTWNPIVGGGVLTITAKTIINNVEVSDTFTGKIEGEKTTDEFRTLMIDYLKSAATLSTPENPSLQTELGTGDVLFTLACVETYGINHFWPSIFGIPTGARYPIENSTGDGGFGVMQLTEWGNLKRPSYEQIWNWKSNIDASLEVVREKIAMAKRQSSNLTQEQIKMNVYSLFNGGYYWKTVFNKETLKYDWVPKYDSESENEKEKKRYRQSGVSHADKAIVNEGSNDCQ